MIQTLQITLSKTLKKNSLTANMPKGISNFQIEKGLKDIDDPDINDNFVGGFTTNRMNRFIDYKTMMLGKRANIFLLLQTLIALTKTALTDGAY